MTAVTPLIALIIFIAVIFIAIFVAFYSRPDEHDKTRIRVFLTTLAGLGIVITFMFYYNVVELQQEQQKTTILEQTSRLNESILETLLVEIRKASLVVPNFTLSLLPLSSCYREDLEDDENSAAACTERYIVSYKIFNVWQNFLQGSYFIRTAYDGYVTNFLQRAHSKALHVIWETCRYDFDVKTQKFGDTLFELSADIKKNNAKTYAKVASKYVQSRSFAELLER